MRKVFGLLLVTLFFHTPATLAQEARARQESTDTLATHRLPDVVVTGTRIGVARENVPLTVSSLSAAEIERSGEPNVLPILSSRMPGVFVTERGITGFGVSEGAAGKISIRGVGGEPNTQVLVLIDGHPVFMGLFGHPLPDTYAATDVERVEVIRGPASILYGTGALGGVVNLVTRRQHVGGLRVGGRLSYGSADTRILSADGGYRRGPVSVFASFNHNATDGHRPSAGFDLTGGYVKAGWALRPGLHLTLDGGLTHSKSYNPGPASAPFAPGSHWVDMERGRASLVLENTSERFNGALRLFHATGRHDIYDGFLSDDRITGLMAYQAVRLLPNSVVTIGADYKHYGGEAENRLQGADFGSHGVDEVGGYVFAQHFFRRLVLNAGLRMERHATFGVETVPQAGLAYHMTPTTTVKGLVSKGFRSPTIRELYLFPAPTPDLEPERMWNYEIGLLHRRARVSAELTAFASRGDNLIQTTGQFPNLALRNTGTFRHRGVEAESWLQASRSLHFRTSYSYLHTDAPLLAAPEHQAFVEAAWTAGIVRLNAQVQHVAGLHTRLQPQPSTEAYTLLSAGLAVRPLPFLDVFVQGENLLDTSYEINDDYPMPGRTVFTGLRLRYE